MPTWCRCAPPILFWHWPPRNLFPGSCLNSIFLSILTLRAAPSKRYAFSTNYNVCITMPTWCRCAPPILFWPWLLYSLFPRSCLASDGYHFVCTECPANATSMPFQQISMNLFLLGSCAPTCSTSSCGHGTSLLWQELVYSEAYKWITEYKINFIHDIGTVVMRAVHELSTMI